MAPKDLPSDDADARLLAIARRVAHKYSVDWSEQVTSEQRDELHVAAEDRAKQAEAKATIAVENAAVAGAAREEAAENLERLNASTTAEPTEVLVAQINALTARYKADAEREVSLRKIEADERANAEKEKSALAIERARADGAAAVEEVRKEAGRLIEEVRSRTEGVKGKYVVLAAVVTGLTGVAGGYLAAKKAAADKESHPSPTTTSGAPEASKTCVLRPIGIRGLKNPELVTLRLELEYGSIPAQHVWITADAVGRGGDIQIPCRGEIHPRLATGDAREKNIASDFGVYQETLPIGPGPKRTFELGRMGSDPGIGVLEFEILSGDATQLHSGE